ncbi:MAG: biotin--[acetyl-CoA-carboxylase] ligase [Armatimonadetes bacterium]|nr:biotin--[acetyl-CoA-carboxylase] ligase [Armatimonadota bacterium]
MTWLEIDETPSTQDEAVRLLLDPADETDVVFARHQTGGKGRFGRTWYSVRGESLAMSLILRGAADHPRPWLFGMHAAVVTAKLVGCRVRWPNDLTWEGRKLGGILTELRPDATGRVVPVVGIGINVGPSSLPSEVRETATTLADAGRAVDPRGLGRDLAAMILQGSWPETWSDLAAGWGEVDDTPGKAYTTVAGERMTAVRVGDDGRLEGLIDGRPAAVMAAESLFGADAGHTASPK